MSVPFIAPHDWWRFASGEYLCCPSCELPTGPYHADRDGYVELRCRCGENAKVLLVGFIPVAESH